MSLAFESLDTTARQTALDKVREWQCNDDYWYTTIIEDAEDLLSHLGFLNGRILFSGFWSQGDGASFTGDWKQNKVELAKAQAEFRSDELKPMFDELALMLIESKLHSKRWSDVTMERRSNEVHESSIIFTFDEMDQDDTLVDSDRFMNWAKSLMRWIYKSLREEYEYLTSDECVIEVIKGNDYRFDESGAIV